MASRSGRPAHFLLGTDTLGRDILVRIAYGARISLFVGVVATRSSRSRSVRSSAWSPGYFGGVTDTLLARLMDWCSPSRSCCSAISLVTVLGPGLAS